jgi:hypothetical protein
MLPRNLLMTIPCTSFLSPGGEISDRPPARDHFAAVTVLGFKEYWVHIDSRLYARRARLEFLPPRDLAAVRRRSLDHQTCRHSTLLVRIADRQEAVMRGTL